jgi:hypothetical protein
MTYLMTTGGESARIHTLPGREPFMLDADLAVIYETKTKRIGEAVGRNLDRFPEDFAFGLTMTELELLRSQNATSSGWGGARYLPLAFTHAGALALSGVLKTPVAAAVSVMVHRGFAAMERQAFDQLRYTVISLQIEAKARSGLRVKMVDGARAGLSFDAIWRMTAASRPKLEKVAHECLALGLIDRLPEGTPLGEADLFVAEARHA